MKISTREGRFKGVGGLIEWKRFNLEILRESKKEVKLKKF